MVGRLQATTGTGTGTQATPRLLRPDRAGALLSSTIPNVPPSPLRPHPIFAPQGPGSGVFSTADRSGITFGTPPFGQMACCGPPCRGWLGSGVNSGTSGVGCQAENSLGVRGGWLCRSSSMLKMLGGRQVIHQLSMTILHLVSPSRIATRLTPNPKAIRSFAQNISYLHPATHSSSAHSPNLIIRFLLDPFPMLAMLLLLLSRPFILAVLISGLKRGTSLLG